MKLSHLLLMVFMVATVVVLLALVFPGLAVTSSRVYWLTLPLSFLIALLLAWPVSRLLRLSPLMIFAGPCPGCKTRPSGWWSTTESDKVRLVLVCGACGERSELWLTRKPPADRHAKANHTFRLRWPQFLGVWATVQRHSGGVR